MKRFDVFRSLGPSIMCISALVFLGLVLAWQHVNSLSTGYRINELKLKKNELEHQRQLLLLEKASLVDYERIEKKARTGQGFREPLPGEQIVFLSETSQLVLYLPKEQDEQRPEE